MDMNMPITDGYWATMRIRKREMLTRRYDSVIAMTAYEIEGDKEKCIECGMNEYF